MYNRLLLFLGISCFLAGVNIAGFAQAPVFKSILFDKEKRDAKISKIFQDRKGYLWLGTNIGICRYDGISFNYLEKDSNQVTAIAENSRGMLWMGHING